jgi:predicted transposase/invertase (TIGR01784 family)
LFIELPRFNKNEKEIETHFEKWMYFLKNLESFERIPEILQEKVFEEAFQIAELANYSPDQRRQYESSLKAYRDNINIIETAKEEGRIEGETKGRFEGKIEGKIEGIQEGKRVVAKNLRMAGFELDAIVTATGLSQHEIEDLEK